MVKIVGAKNYTKEKIIGALTLLAEGKVLSEVSKLTGVSYNLLSQWANKAHIKPKRKLYNKIDWLEIREIFVNHTEQEETK